MGFIIFIGLLPTVVFRGVQMLDKILSRLSKPNFTEENVAKQFKNWKLTFLERPGFAKKYAGIEVFQRRKDLRGEFLKRFPEEMKIIVTQSNPVYLFRSKIIDNIKVNVINSVLLEREFTTRRRAICESINRGMKHLAETWNDPNFTFDRAMSAIERIETFFDEAWCYNKVVLECSWAEVEGLALRHMQVFLFRERVGYHDWWSIFQKAYEEYIGRAYRLIASNPEKPEGWPHPLWIAMTNDALMQMEDKILSV